MPPLVSNPIDSAIDLVKRRVKDSDFWDSSFSDENYLKQYIAYHMLHGNALWTTNMAGDVVGILIAYECDEEYARNPFIWTEPLDKSCIFVAQLVAEDQESRDILAQAFLEQFPVEKPAFAIRRGQFTSMNPHKIAEELIRRRDENGGR